MPGGLALATVIVGIIAGRSYGRRCGNGYRHGLAVLLIMVRYRYDHKLATGAITASGTLAQLLPPSLVLVVLSSTVGVPVGDLFLVH